MYCKEQNEIHKPKKTHRNLPSFSSTLLDEICRSIDGNAGSPEHFPATGSRPKSSSSSRDEEISRFSRACLVDKWMTEREVNKKSVAQKSDTTVFPDTDSFFFTSTSSSSDSSGVLSSSDTDFFRSSSKSSCTPRPKPVRTSSNIHSFLFDDYQNHEKNRVEDDSMKSKSRALNVYANLKKLKQPISPGGKLTSLINSFFASLSRKTSRNIGKYRSEETRGGIEREVKLDQDPMAIKMCGKYGKPPLPRNALKNQRKCDLSMFSKDEEDDDGFSESSLDLFELDHLSLYGRHDRLCEELPVYETTYFDKNHRGYIR